jgi:hypothetical protein
MTLMTLMTFFNKIEKNKKKIEKKYKMNIFEGHQVIKVINYILSKNSS